MTKKDLRAGSVLGGRFRIKSCGTSRDMGTVFVAWDMIASRAVHLLLLAPGYGTGQAVQRRLVRSQESFAALRQPALVPFELVGAERRRESGAHLFLVHRLLDGETLASRLAREGRLEHDAAIELATRLCQALAVAHRSGLVHGSLTPDNVLLQDDGGLLVTDVGLWAALHPGPGMPVTPSPWRPPEQASGEAGQPSADVYAIGALFYLMLAGQPPLGTPVRPGLSRLEPVRLQQLAPRVPTWLAQIVHKTLAPEPSQRYRHAGQLLQILRSGARAGPGPLGGVPVAGGSAAAARPDSVYRRPVGAAVRAVQPAVAWAPEVPELEPSPIDAGTLVPDAYEPWTYVPGANLPTVYEPDLEPLRRRRSSADVILLILLVAAVLAVLGLIPLWWNVYQRWSASLDSPSSVPYRQPEDRVPVVYLAEMQSGDRVAVTGTLHGCATADLLNLGQGGRRCRDAGPRLLSRLPAHIRDPISDCRPIREPGNSQDGPGQRPQQFSI